MTEDVLIYNLAKVDDLISIQNKLVTECDDLEERGLPFPAAEFPATLTTVKEIIAYHKKEHPKEKRLTGGISPNYLFVVDRVPVEEHGILHVELNYQAGVPDARRMPAEPDTGFCSHALVTACSDWYTDRENAYVREPTPLRAHYEFVVYFCFPDFNDSTEGQDPKIFGKIHLLLDMGIDNLTQFLEPLDPDESPIVRDLYVPTPANDKTIDQIKADHPCFASSKNANKSMFIIVDPDWKEKGFLFVKLGGDGEQQDEFRHRGPKAGELLHWIWVGLLTWGEAKAEEEIKWPADDQITELARLVSRSDEHEWWVRCLMLMCVQTEKLSV